jgi:ribosomal protein S18 acetylase RimI-like enzyme
MDIVVRDYRSSDWNSVEDMILKAENFGEVFLEHERIQLEVYSKNPKYGRVFVAEDSESQEVVGFTSVRIDWNALVISTIIVHHNRLRKGIGSALVEEVARFGKSCPNIETIWVDTGDFMHYAQEFYKSCGFDEVARVPHYMSSQFCQVFFIRKLKGGR